MDIKKVSNIEYDISSNKLDNFNEINYVGKDQIENNRNIDKDINLKKEPNYKEIETNDKFQNISLPSGFIFYDFDTLRVRKFEIRDLAKMARVQETQSYKLFKDVIQGCVDKDINCLTAGDFRYICYWIRLNSYVKTPISIEWVSKYGNKNIAQVRKNEIITYAPDIKKEELDNWYNKGFEVPTLKFSDIFEETLDADKYFTYGNAQYFKGNTWEEKIENLEKYTIENGLESLNDVHIFDKLIDHGVKEEITVYDSLFDPNEYKKKLEEKLNRLKLTLNNLIKKDSEEARMLELMNDKIKNEYNELVKKLENGEVVQAEPETLFLEMGPFELLSPVLSSITGR